MVLNNFAIVLRDRGNLRGARAHWEEALELKDTSGDLRGASIVRLNLGLLVTIEGDPRFALKIFTQATKTLRDLGNQSLLAEGLLALADTHIRIADFQSAANDLEELEVLCETLDEAQYTDRTSFVRVLLEFEQGNNDGLLNRVRPIFDRLHEIGDPEIDSSTRPTLIRMLLDEGRVPEAKTEIEWARAAAEKSGSLLFRHQIAIVEADVMAATGKSHDAKSLLQTVIREAAGSGYVSTSLEARLGLAKIEAMTSDTRATKDMITDLAAEAERRGFKLIAIRARELMTTNDK